MDRTTFRATSTAKSLGVLAAALIAYALAYRWLYEFIGVRAQVLTVVPLILGGVLFGVRGAFGVWVVTTIIRLVMLRSLGVESWWQFGGDPIGAGVGLLVGCAIGLVRDIDLRRRRAVDSKLALNESLERTNLELKRAQAELQLSELKYRALVEAADDAIAIADFETARFLEANRAATDLFGYSLEEFRELKGRQLSPPDEKTEVDRVSADLIAHGHAWHPNIRLARKDGSVFWGELRVTSYQVADRKLEVAIMRDVSRRVEHALNLERQLMHAQKMEALGLLAGGVAHDLNNVLTIVLGNATLVGRQIQRGTPAAEAVDGIVAAAKSAVGVTRGLLAFSRRQTLKPRDVDLNEHVLTVGTMLRPAIGEDIELVIEPGQDAGFVRADPSHLEQALLNLVVNARDAMPRGGRLEIVTGREPGDKARSFVSVSDTGVGIDADVLPRIFEPFFTTKDVGRGTGLGLSTVFGIVKQHGGDVTVRSELGRGTMFRMLLPAVDGAGAIRDLPVRKLAGDESVLVVEDDPGVRRLTTGLLRDLGYRVLEAGSAREALDSIESDGGRAVQLLLTDVIMPETSGKELADLVRAARPEVRVLFMSGYTADVLGRHGVLEPGVEFLEKPFSVDTLARRIREVLDA